jgi:uncharacterized membrane protein YphA (DoxX/SURF4 family)
MILTRQFGNPLWAPLIIRISIGGYIFFLGLWAIQEPELFANNISFISGISGTLLSAYTTICPYVFVVCGLCLALGFLTSGMALLSFMLVFPLYLGANILNVQGITVQHFGEKRQFYKTIVLLCSMLSLLFSGPGILSLDHILQKIYRKN